MRPLVIYCHPSDTSYTNAVKRTVISCFQQAELEYRLADLYSEEFRPILSEFEWKNYESMKSSDSLRPHIEDLQWCDAIFFIYPTWWFGLPAMLKGWLDRVLLPDVAFSIPTAKQNNVQPQLQHIKKLTIFTTCGASWAMTKLVGEPGRKTIFRGIGVLCGRLPINNTYLAHYRMDNSTDKSRRKHLERVARETKRIIRNDSRC